MPAQWWEVADLTRRQGAAAHERIFAVAADLRQGVPVSIIGADQARAAIAARRRRPIALAPHRVLARRRPIALPRQGARATAGDRAWPDRALG
ncbi:hypothetical protein [Nocardia sp. NPDC057227]|uniref:hypothetical protein n=1 Tax=Nocardia sp. NPDC057227 TaxID=3346056 RepID=UPI0036442576